MPPTAEDPIEQRGFRQFTLTVDLDAHPVVGWLRAESGDEESFTGWLGLAGALDALRSRTAQKRRT